MKREIQCHCGNTIETDFSEEIDLVKHPETIDEIINGTFMSVTCDTCGAVLKPEFRTHIYDSSGRIDITFLPELERTAYLAGRVQADSERVAVGFSELREKILILKADLDDRAVEILKFLLLEKSENPEEVNIILVEIQEENELVFHLHGMKKDEVGVTSIPFHLYRKVYESLDERVAEEPYSSIAQGQYVSINKITIEDEES